MPTLLLAKADFVAYIDLPLNFDMAKLNTYILSFQQIHAKQVLTAELYDDFVTKYADSIATNNPTALDADYTKLREALVPYLVFGSYLEYLPFSRQKPTNAGLVQKQNEKSDRVSSEELGVKMLYLQRKFAEYREALVAFLTDNKAIYTLYKPVETCEDEEIEKGRIVALGKPEPDLDTFFYWQS